MNSILATAAPPPPSRLRVLLERPATQHTIMALILVNATLLGLETWPAAKLAAGGLIGTLDRVLLGVFVVEIAARLVVHRAAFWRDPWSRFDFVVVGTAAHPVLRVRGDRDQPVRGSLPGRVRSHRPLALHAVQVMTLESWSMGIARPVMAQFPYAWMFFVVFTLVATFTMLNLFTAIIVNAMQRYSDGESKGDTAEQGEAGVREELRALRVQIERSSASLAVYGSREGESR